MSKRRSDTQLTKDDYEAQMNGGFSFSANRSNSEGGPEDQADPSKMADSKVMMGRKIAPLKKGRGRGGAVSGPRGGGGGGSNIPNLFAGMPSTVFGANGTAQQPADGGMSRFGGSFGTANTAPSPTFGGNATGGFGFGTTNNNATEQPKVNPFGSLAPTPSTNGGGGGGGGIFPQAGSSLFGNSPAPQNASSGGIFGSNNSTTSPAPVASGFLFGNNNNPAPIASTTNFKTPAFSFSNGGNTAPPVFGGGDNKPASPSFAFGSNAATPAVTPPATSSFNFGSSTATAPAANSGGYFGAPSPAPEKTSEPPATPSITAPTPPPFQFNSTTPIQGSSLFGKPMESQGSSLFGRPSPSPEPSSNLFAPKLAPNSEPNSFGSPTPAANNFFAQPKVQEPAKPLFGFGEQKHEVTKEVSKSFFGGFGSPVTEKKEEPSKPLFGFGAAAGKEQEPVKETPRAQSPFSFGAPSVKDDDDDDAMDENSPPKQSIFDSQLSSNSNSFSGFGTPKPAFAAAPTNHSTPPSVFAPTTKTPTSTTTTNARTPSPPIPSEATSWTPAQLTEYYNLYALRSLNHSFFEGLKKADVMGDWSAVCGIYIKESARIKGCQENGERYKGAAADSKVGLGVSTKRGMFGGGRESESEGGGKRRKDNNEESKVSSDSSKALAGILGGSSVPDFIQKQASKSQTTSPFPFSEGQKLASKLLFGFKPPTASTAAFPFSEGQKLASKPLFGFKPPTASTAASSVPDLSQKLASKPVFAFNPPVASALSESGLKLADKPLFGFQPPAPVTANESVEEIDGSIFDNPSAPVNNGGFVNPFTIKKPDLNDRDMDDEESDGEDKQPSGTSSAGSLFGRISEPRPSTSTSGSIFGSTPKSTGELFGGKVDQTWSPVNGVKFESTTNGNGNGSIFGNKPLADSKPGFFGGSAAPSNAAAPGASVTSSLFSTPGPKPEVGFSFGGNGTTKPSGPISIPPFSTASRDTSAPLDDTSSEPNDNAHLAKNAVDLSVKGPGEEDEDSVFEVRTIIYELLGGGVAPKKVAVASLRVLKNRLTKKARVVARTDGGKVVLNVGLVKGISYALSEKGGKNVNLVEFLPEGKSPRRYSLRVKKEEDAEKLSKVMESAKVGS